MCTLRGTTERVRNTTVNHFTICHYAGQVAYNVEGWVEKNRDHVEHCILELMSGSEHPLIGNLFPRLGNIEVRSRRGSIANATVSYIYKVRQTYMAAISHEVLGTIDKPHEYP